MSKYMTKQGDMWDQIAYNELGSTSHTDALMNANQQYKDIYIFPSGIELILPDIDIEKKVSESLPPWKKV